MQTFEDIKAEYPWAEYIARDYSGDISLYSDRPILSKNYFHSVRGREKQIHNSSSDLYSFNFQINEGQCLNLNNNKPTLNNEMQLATQERLNTLEEEGQSMTNLEKEIEKLEQEFQKKTADELFAELGYVNIGEISTLSKYALTCGGKETYIIFNKQCKTYAVKGTDCYIDMVTNRAINQKIKELGW